MAGRAWWEWTFWMIVGLTTLHSFGWLNGMRPQVIREGQPCGPGFVWRSTGGIDPDLSCERLR